MRPDVVFRSFIIVREPTRLVTSTAAYGGSDMPPELFIRMKSEYLLVEALHPPVADPGCTISATVYTATKGRSVPRIRSPIAARAIEERMATHCAGSRHGRPLRQRHALYKGFTRRSSPVGRGTRQSAGCPQRQQQLRAVHRGHNTPPVLAGRRAALGQWHDADNPRHGARSASDWAAF